ncbi:MAG: nucleotidyltransferase family protein [Paludibacter sp.]|jgi:hypothetical protein|nr:nucleotidyltransferase family protein [Paludibacter sp.]
MITPEQQILFLAAKINLSADELAQLDKLLQTVKNWDKLLELLTTHAAAPLFYSKLKNLKNAALIPQNIQSLLMQTYYKVMKNNILLYDAFSQLLAQCAEQKIKIIALKGIYLAQTLYGDIALRQMSDIDILVNQSDGQKVLEILNSLGYKSAAGHLSDFIDDTSGLVHYDPMVRDNIIVELHINLHYKNRNYSMDTKQVIENSEEVNINNCKVFSLDIYDLIIYLCIHTDKHFGEAGQTQFTVFYDLLNILEIRGNEINWNKLEQRASVYNANEVVFKYLLLTAFYFNAHLPSQIGDKYNFLISKKIHRLFRKNLQKITLNQYTTIHFATIRQMQSNSKRLHYIFDALFPPKKFMLLKYSPKNPKFYWLYYPVRHFRAAKYVFLNMF